MQIGRQRHVYHFHINKCGGNTVAGWLEQHVADRRLLDRRRIALNARLWRMGEASPAEAAAAEAEARQMFFGADAPTTHACLLAAAPPGTFAFTVLRRPAARVVSQVSDWRRLGPHDVVDSTPATARLILDAGAMPLGAYLRAHGRAPSLDNRMTRALAEPTWGHAAQSVAARDLLDAALDNLERRLALVGLAERMDETLAALAEALGFAPPGPPLRLNDSGSRTAMAEEIDAAAPWLAEATACDDILYRRAEELFEARGAGRGYDRAAFEARFAAATLADLRGEAHGDDVVFSVRDPVVATGLMPRDGPGLASSCVWSGPGPRFTLYMPAPAGARLEVKLWVRGYATAAQRERLRLAVDGVSTEPRFAAADGYAEAVSVEARPTRAFLALDVDVGAASTTGAPGSAMHDPRPRGLAFDRYGWRALPD